eukprot:gene1722-4842_t
MTSCDDVKDNYDRCFNAWLATFLKAPTGDRKDTAPARYPTRDSATNSDQFTPCKELYDAYQSCLDNLDLGETYGIKKLEIF